MLSRRLSLFALSLFVALTALAGEDTLRKGFNVQPGGTLRLDAGFGNVKIVSGGTGVAVEVVRTAHGRGSEERIREHKIDFKQSGDDVSITSNFENRWDRWFSDFDVQWNIRVPAKYNVDVRTSGGSIDIANIGGTVAARTSGGSVQISGASGEIVANTSGGSIDIGNSTARVEARTSGGSINLGHVGGEVLARTSGGDIRIEDAAGRVDASTSGGSIEASISHQPAGDSRLSTSGGGVTVRIAGGIGVDLDAHASGGGVHAELPVTIQGTQDDDSLQGRIGNGGPKLVLRSSGGGIHVRGM